MNPRKMSCIFVHHDTITYADLGQYDANQQSLVWYGTFWDPPPPICRRLTGFYPSTGKASKPAQRRISCSYLLSW